MHGRPRLRHPAYLLSTVTNYLKCVRTAAHITALQGVFDYAKKRKLLSADVLAKGLPGLNVLVSGNVPPGGGLSSSRCILSNSHVIYILLFEVGWCGKSGQVHVVVHMLQCRLVSDRGFTLMVLNLFLPQLEIGP